MTSVTINYDLILDTALRGVRRAAVFMGLGVNAALDPNFKSYQLTNIAAIQPIPPGADEKTIAHYKENFALWITANGLRELIEAFSVFLDQVSYASTNIAVHKGQRTRGDGGKRYRQFIREGVKKKLETLNADFNIVASHPDHIETIQLARNCLTHRLGQVGRINCNQGSELVVKWISIDILATTKDGTSTVMDLPLREPVLLEGPGTISARLTERERRYSPGTVISIPPKDLAEMCWFIAEEARSVIRSALDYARRVGIEIKLSDNTTDSSQASNSI